MNFKDISVAVSVYFNPSIEVELYFIFSVRVLFTFYHALCTLQVSCYSLKYLIKWIYNISMSQLLKDTEKITPVYFPSIYFIEQIYTQEFE